MSSTRKSCGHLPSLAQKLIGLTESGVAPSPYAALPESHWKGERLDRRRGRFWTGVGSLSGASMRRFVRRRSGVEKPFDDD